MTIRHTRRSHRPDSRRGFTLLSMLVALVLLSVGVMALAQANAATVKVGAQSANRGLALAVARGYLEEVRSRDPWTLETESPQRVGSNGEPNSLGPYTRSMTVTELRTNLIQVQIAVEYPNPTSPVSVDTYLYRPNGLNNPNP
jgi:type II secretory pathway pseudopilin PulG